MVKRVQAVIQALDLRYLGQSTELRVLPMPGPDSAWHSLEALTCHVGVGHSSAHVRSEKATGGKMVTKISVRIPAPLPDVGRDVAGKASYSGCVGNRADGGWAGRWYSTRRE